MHDILPSFKSNISSVVMMIDLDNITFLQKVPRLKTLDEAVEAKAGAICITMQQYI